MIDRAKWKHRDSRLRAMLGVTALVAFIADLAAVLVWRAGRLDPVDLSTLMILFTVVGLVSAGLAVTYSPSPIPDTGLVPTEPAEKSLSWRLLGNVATGFAWTLFGTMKSIRASDDGDPLMGYAFAALVLLWAALSPGALMGWAPGFRLKARDPDGELNRVFRARATASGFWALLAGGGAAYLISFSTPEALRWILPFVLWLGGSIACIHFAWLHHRADEDLHDDG